MRVAEVGGGYWGRWIVEVLMVDARPGWRVAEKARGGEKRWWQLRAQRRASE